MPTTTADEKWAIQRLIWSRGSRQDWRTVSQRPMSLKRALNALVAPHSGEIRLITGVEELMKLESIERTDDV